MEGFTIIDGVVAAVVIISALLAYSRGLVREVMAIAGWVAAAILAFLFAPTVEPMVREIPVVGEFVAESCELSMIGGFAIVFAISLIVVSLFTPLFSSIVQRSAAGGVDQGLGFLFGVARGILLVALALFVYDTVMTGQEYRLT
jgi:membrane protein required for colicin V production